MINRAWFVCFLECLLHYENLTSSMVFLGLLSVSVLSVWILCFLSSTVWTFNIICLYFTIELASEWGGHEMSTLWHHHPEKRWMWLDLLFDVQNRNLLGYETSSLGTKCKYSHTYSTRSTVLLQRWVTHLTCRPFFSFCRALVTHLVAVDVE